MNWGWAEWGMDTVQSIADGMLKTRDDIHSQTQFINLYF